MVSAGFVSSFLFAGTAMTAFAVNNYRKQFYHFRNNYCYGVNKQDCMNYILIAIKFNWIR